MIKHISSIVNSSLSGYGNSPLHVVSEKNSDTREPELIYVTEPIWMKLQSIKKEIAPHKNSKRVNPKYSLFKLLSGRIMNCPKGCFTTQDTLGDEIKSYGYDKTLGERQIRRHSGFLKDKLGIINYDTPKGKKINVYTLPELGQLVYWLIIKANKGLKQVKFSESPPMDYDELKKCPVFDEENVRSYIDLFYSDYTLNHPQTFQADDQSKSLNQNQKPFVRFQGTGDLPNLIASANHKEADLILRKLTNKDRIKACKDYDNFARVNLIVSPIDYLRFVVNKVRNETEVDLKKAENQKRLANEDREKSLRLLKECQSLNKTKDEWEEGISTEENKLQKENAIKRMQEMLPDFRRLRNSTDDSFRRRH